MLFRVESKMLLKGKIEIDLGAILKNKKDQKQMKHPTQDSQKIK